MEKHHRLVNDPRIMEPLEEFLRTVREVVQVPSWKEDEDESPSSDYMPPRKRTIGCNQLFVV